MPARAVLPRGLVVGLLGLVVAFSSGCDRLQSLPADPPQTPQAFLAGQPFVELTLASHRVVVVQPTSTVLVYLLGVVTLAVGIRFLRTRGPHRSRRWWGVGLLLWGLGALLAGTSYQAFAYEIKCAGRATCAWTSGWEVLYLIATASSVDALVLAVAHACAAGRWRRALTVYAAANAGSYLAVVLLGALVPVRFLVSFELLLVVTTPGILTLLGLNLRRHRWSGSSVDRALVGAWLLLGFGVVAYYVYLVLGVAQALWSRGIWLSENDVLHGALVAWMIYVALVVSPALCDRPD
jgi:hypothetical protein